MADQQQMQIRIPDEVLKGRYANLAYVNASKEEFVLDFGVILPQQRAGIITDRIFMNPGHVKRVIEVLQRVMAEYEKQHGSVQAAETPREIGFQTA